MQKKYDRVWSCIHGWGEIINNSKYEKMYQLKIRFERGKIIFATLDGRENYYDKYPTIFWNEHKIPTIESNDIPLNICNLLSETLEVKEFECGEYNYSIDYSHEFNSFTTIITKKIETLGRVYFKDVPNSTLKTLNDNGVTLKQLKEAYKELGWL